MATPFNDDLEIVWAMLDNGYKYHIIGAKVTPEGEIIADPIEKAIDVVNASPARNVRSKFSGYNLITVVASHLVHAELKTSPYPPKDIEGWAVLPGVQLPKIKKLVPEKPKNNPIRPPVDVGKGQETPTAEQETTPPVPPAEKPQQPPADTVVNKREQPEQKQKEEKVSMLKKIKDIWSRLMTRLKQKSATEEEKKPAESEVDKTADDDGGGNRDTKSFPLWARLVLAGVITLLVGLVVIRAIRPNKEAPGQDMAGNNSLTNSSSGYPAPIEPIGSNVVAHGQGVATNSPTTNNSQPSAMAVITPQAKNVPATQTHTAPPAPPSVTTNTPSKMLVSTNSMPAIQTGPISNSGSGNIVIGSTFRGRIIAGADVATPMKKKKQAQNKQQPASPKKTRYIDPLERHGHVQSFEEVFQEPVVIYPGETVVVATPAQGWLVRIRCDYANLIRGYVTTRVDGDEQSDEIHSWKRYEVDDIVRWSRAHKIVALDKEFPVPMIIECTRDSNRSTNKPTRVAASDP